MGSPPGPVAGGAPQVWRDSPVHRPCHAVAPRHSHRVAELAQHMWVVGAYGRALLVTQFMYRSGWGDRL